MDTSWIIFCCLIVLDISILIQFELFVAFSTCQVLNIAIFSNKWGKETN